jgi:hypothetical protein
LYKRSFYWLYEGTGLSDFYMLAGGGEEVVGVEVEHVRRRKLGRRALLGRAVDRGNVKDFGIE